MTTTAPPAGPAPREETPDASTLSTQPRPLTGPSRGGVFASARRGWRWLTSMRTALILLFLLAGAAVPGSLLPQHTLNQTKVDRYFTQHPGLAPILDRLGFFDVFGSPWFAAIYLLLFISLVGCLVPRIRLHTRALWAPPPLAPRNLSRLPESAAYSTGLPPEEAADRAKRTLRGWRVVTRSEPDGAITLSAEKGYLRETGNLVFHVALTVLLVGVAVGRLWGYQGTVLVEEGKGFCNSVSLYDSFRSGRLINGNDLAPFCVDRLNSFTATYDPDGTPNMFRADITYSAGASGAPHRYQLEVNKPLRMEGNRLYLLSHGFSPRFTVRMPSGQLFKDVSAPFLPQNGELLSEGVVKLPDARPKQLALYGLFAPTAADAGNGVLTSLSGRPDLPAVAIVVYRGDLGLDSGVPQSVYSLDQGQIRRGALKDVARKNLAVGQSMTLDDGTVITFDGYRQWATMQVSRDPGQAVVLGAAVAIVAGLLLSLAVRRRRFWLRIRPVAANSSGGPDDPGPTLVEVGGLARTDAGSFTGEFSHLVDRLREPLVPSARKD